MTESRFARKRRQSQQHRRAAWALLRGLPAVMVIVVGIVCLTRAHLRQQDGNTRQRYLTAAEEAVTNEDWRAAELLGRKLVDLRTNDPVGKYVVALSAAGEGDSRRAARLMLQIAPADAPGFAPAQWWLVQHLASSPHERTAAHTCQLRNHVRQYLVTYDGHPEALMILGQAEIALGNIDEGLAAMTTASGQMPELLVTVSQVAQRLERTKIARGQAEQAAHWLQQQVQDTPLDVTLRLRYAQTLSMLGQVHEAAQILITGLSLVDDSRLQAGLVKLAVTSFDLLNGAERTGRVFDQQLQMLAATLKVAPYFPPLLKRLAVMATDPRDVDGRARELLQPYIEDETAPPVVFMVLGRDAMARQQFDEARDAFEVAHRQLPNFAACQNNLAWSLMHCSEPDLPRALLLVEQAIADQPERSEFHESRGQILARIGRFEEAVPALVRGLDTPSPIRPTHAVLADVYDALGKVELAAHYRELK